MNEFIVLFFNMLLWAIIFLNYGHSTYGTTDSNYFISFTTEAAAFWQHTATPGGPAAAGGEDSGAATLHR